MLRDLEDDEEVEDTGDEPTGPIDREAVAGELARVEDFVARAKSLPHDAKARSFQDAIRVILDLGRDGRGSGKAVVFTESITTQEYLRRLLLDIGLQDEDVTLFRGTTITNARSRRMRAGWRKRDATCRPGRGRRARSALGSPWCTSSARGRRSSSPPRRAPRV